jgi:CP family cyanate transporter-like MFS transporter
MSGRRSLWREPLAWNVMAFMGLVTLVFYGCLSWIRAIYLERALSEAYGGFLLMVLNLTGFVRNVIAPTVGYRCTTSRRARP